MNRRYGRAYFLFCEAEEEVFRCAAGPREVPDADRRAAGADGRFLTAGRAFAARDAGGFFLSFEAAARAGEAVGVLPGSGRAAGRRSARASPDAFDSTPGARWTIRKMVWSPIV